MLPKKNRVDRKGVEKIFKEGEFLSSPNLSFKYVKGVANERKISFVAPKSVAKLAVKRNLLRRRGYSALAKHLDQFPAGILAVFIFKKYQDDLSVLENEIKGAISRIQ